MLFERIGILDENFEYRPSMWVGVRDERIAYVGDTPPADASSFGRRYDGAGRLLMPAFYNAHSHSSMTLLRGYAENLPLQQWLFDRVFPFEALIQPKDCYWGSLLACAEMARFGVASFSDMYFNMDQVGRAVVESGLKANLCDDLVTFEDVALDDLPLRSKMDALVRDLHGAGNGRVSIGCGIHAEYTTRPCAVADMVDYAAARGLRLCMHLSETQLEHEQCKQRHDGMTPTRYFDSLGVFDVPVTAAHCVWCDDDDIRVLAQRGASVACNPASNMKLASGFAPIPKMIDAGVNVCLGTDGMASNNSHNMFQGMRLMALIYKGAQLDPTAVGAKDALRAVTRAGALAQGRVDCGLVKEGMRADVCVLDVSGPQWHPMTDPTCNVVHSGSGSDVVLTMVDGRVVYRDGEWPTMDLERIRAEVAAAAKRIAGQV